jgi:hypothetical protein
MQIDQLIQGLDAGIAILTHRKLRSKNFNAQQSSGPPPLLVTLVSPSDQTKLLSISSRLHSHPQFSTVFIREALTSSELKEVSVLREHCRAANDALVHETSGSDSGTRFKFVVIDGKIRRSNL